jgi:hypothetical protein
MRDTSTRGEPGETPREHDPDGHTELSPETRLHIEKSVDVLVEEFGEHHTRETVERIMDDSVRQLTRSHEVEDFLPALAHRFTRERLKALSRAHGPESAEPDVLFVGLS